MSQYTRRGVNKDMAALDGKHFGLDKLLTIICFVILRSQGVMRSRSSITVRPFSVMQ